jgi:hypothetical protein
MMNDTFFRMAVIALAGLVLNLTAPRARSSEKEATRFFEKEVRPLLKASCFACHGDSKKIKGGLRLTSREAILKGGNSGPAVVLEKPEQSLLLQAVNYVEPKMPPKGRLPQAQIEILTRWVRMGIPWPAGAKQATAKPHGPPPVDEQARQFWSFRPVIRPVLPVVKETGWLTNPIDCFVLAKLEAAGLEPAPPADKGSLLRRVYYDLIGLPPTPAEVDAFLADRSPDAYEKVVDRLLASPHYGEHWARHWLDLVRYAESNSFERDAAKPNVWHYRDYVIRSLNQDKPYNQFIREQLAGDELEKVTADSLIATGYYRLGQWDDEPVDPVQARYDELDDIVATTGQVFLGLTVNCARCHDHKIDPFPQKDYYRLLAFFQGIQRYGVRSPQSVAKASVRPIPGQRLQTDKPAALAEALCVTEIGRTPRETFVLLRGNPQAKGEKVEPGFPSVLTAAAPILPRPGSNAHSSGRRRVLADWIADTKNPLTARVITNRLWQYHFGRGIVRSSSNFGYQGTPPTHPELLDWLASEFVARGWKLKAVHRLMVLSSTYRMSSRPNTTALAKDPENDLFWRFNPRRLTAEEVRDSILAACGNLNAHKMGGPSVYPIIPREVLAGQSMPGAGWGHSPPEDRNRRSIYIHLKRSLAVPLLAAFDAADTDASCPVRFTTTQPAQALALLNSDFLNAQAKVFAADLLEKAGADPVRQVRLALRRTLQRAPSAGEVERGVKFMQRMRTEHHLAPDEALRCFCLLALNLNEFIYLD